MTYKDIPDANLLTGQPGRSVDGLALRDNALALGAKNLLVFEASGTLTLTPQLKASGFLVVCIGGGAGGSDGSPDGSGGGGSGGGSVIKRITPEDVANLDTIAVTVAAAGGTSSFGGFCSAPGSGGTGSNDGGTGPALTMTGQAGGTRVRGPNASGGAGGSSIFGGGGQGGQDPDGDGGPGGRYGGGGGGGAWDSGQGAPGAPGVVFILY